MIGILISNLLGLAMAAPLAHAQQGPVEPPAPQEESKPFDFSGGVALGAEHNDNLSVAELESASGPIDVWINNAMATVFSPVALTPPDEFRRVTEVTYLGVVHGTLSALRRMLPRNRGRIVQVGSALAYRGIPLQSAYCAAKRAVQGFCESVRAELVHSGTPRQVS